MGGEAVGGICLRSYYREETWDSNNDRVPIRLKLKIGFVSQAENMFKIFQRKSTKKSALDLREGDIFNDIPSNSMSFNCQEFEDVAVFMTDGLPSFD